MTTKAEKQAATWKVYSAGYEDGLERARVVVSKALRASEPWTGKEETLAWVIETALRQIIQEELKEEPS